MKPLTLLLLGGVSICCADTLVSFTVTSTPALSNQISTLTGTIDCPFTTGSGACVITLSTLSANLPALLQGDSLTSWNSQEVNLFTANAGVLTSGLFMASDYATVAAAQAANQPFQTFFINTTPNYYSVAPMMGLEGYLSGFVSYGVGTTGNYTIQDNSSPVAAITFPVTVTPEPAGFGLMGVGLLVLAASQRRSRASK